MKMIGFGNDGCEKDGCILICYCCAYLFCFISLDEELLLLRENVDADLVRVQGASEHG